ncbi:hypothetical protein ERICV_00520 [Paenibacillus larvae subsp. larvae]|uniref:Uncharacterized protein n=1 Tax=Paenibacillus larvae subsp. larvae TaxID=147375 RepID=A0A6C0QLT6_9BACL|nr:hypothetical protein ERICV_00520 [Paenibacillus larvae subsp. larvae]
MWEKALSRHCHNIAPARHADLGANLWQHVVVSVGRLLESLVAVNDQSRHVFRLFKGVSKRLEKQLIIVAPTYVVGQILDG